ncbi:hypothetical protein BpHYR1_011426 [Brachionus plicatilis]|uniref:Tc1-like transposase DDE domain-containing protein n=1 Tax=Brachionus plicatilis TaxID=10195 RepID=A0A3M7RFM0_BRAPC|nr:hypothetical protein BpHYR1_011426 [Brachionus plicatilis]
MSNNVSLISNTTQALIFMSLKRLDMTCQGFELRFRLLTTPRQRPKASVDCFLIKSPPKSPDFNLIELIWNELKQHVRKRMILTEADAKMAKLYKSFKKVVLAKNGDCSNH